MATVCIQIGNSDDKLTQSRWAEYVADVNALTTKYSSHTHFFGGSPNWMPWQNACWVCEVRDDLVSELKRALSKFRVPYDQESMAVLVGETEFV